MYNHQLIELLKTFTNKEMMWFGKFLNSPYFNNRKMLVRLFQILKRFYPEFDNKNLNKEYIYKLLYYNTPYNDSTFRNLMSDLLQLAQQYLKQEGFEKKEIESSFFLTEELVARGLTNLFNNRTTVNDNILENNRMDSDFFINKYRNETQKFYANLMTKKVMKKNFVTIESQKLINGIAFILSYFVIESIKHNDILLSYSRSYNIKKNIKTISEFSDILNIEKMISYVRKNSSINIPVIEVYYNLLKTFINFDNESYYKDFKKSLLSNSKYFGMNDNHFLYSRLINYCVIKKNQGYPSSFDLDNELFEIYQVILRNAYYKSDVNIYIPFDFYRNILMNCIDVKKLSFMEEFIFTYSKKLNPKNITNVENYSYALLNFERGLHQKALEYLSNITIDQFVYKLDIKNLLLKIYYELEQFEAALSMIDTYKHFVNNNELVSESRRIIHNNFINYTNKLIQYRTGSNQINLLYITQKIERAKNIYDKEWVLNKIYGLTKSYKKVAG